MKDRHVSSIWLQQLQRTVDGSCRVVYVSSVPRAQLSLHPTAPSKAPGSGRHAHGPTPEVHMTAMMTIYMAHSFTHSLTHPHSLANLISPYPSLSTSPSPSPPPAPSCIWRMSPAGQHSPPGWQAPAPPCTPSRLCPPSALQGSAQKKGRQRGLLSRTPTRLSSGTSHKSITLRHPPPYAQANAQSLVVRQSFNHVTERKRLGGRGRAGGGERGEPQLYPVGTTHPTSFPHPFPPLLLGSEEAKEKKGPTSHGRCATLQHVQDGMIIPSPRPADKSIQCRIESCCATTPHPSLSSSPLLHFARQPSYLLD